MRLEDGDDVATDELGQGFGVIVSEEKEIVLDSFEANKVSDAAVGKAVDNTSHRPGQGRNMCISKVPVNFVGDGRRPPGIMAILVCWQSGTLRRDMDRLNTHGHSLCEQCKYL